MKKIIAIIGILIIGIIYFIVSTYKIKRICFGDVCPDNGGVFLLYKFPYTKKQCLAKSSYPVEGISWGPVYAGCSPIKNHQLSR